MSVERWGRIFWRLGAGVWIGTIFFLFFGIAPNVFRVLPEPYAGRMVDALFPIYYGIGLAFGGLLLLGAVLRVGSARIRDHWVLVAVGAANFLMVVWADRILAAMNRLQPSSAVFHALHQRSLAIGVVVFLVMLFGTVFEAVKF